MAVDLHPQLCVAPIAESSVIQCMALRVGSGLTFHRYLLERSSMPALDSQGEYELADVLYKLAIKDDEKDLGPDHPEHAKILINRATVLSKQVIHLSPEIDLCCCSTFYSSLRTLRLPDRSCFCGDKKSNRLALKNPENLFAPSVEAYLCRAHQRMDWN